MTAVFYEAMFLSSLVLMVLYMLIWHKHFDVHVTLIFVLVPVTNLGYFLLTRANTLEEAVGANILTYISGCYLTMLMTLSVFSMCHIRVSRWVRVGMLAVSTVVFLSALDTVRGGTSFYRSVTFERVGGAAVLRKEYGPMHTVFIALVFVYFLLSIGAMVYSYYKKKQVSRRVIFLLFLPVALAMFSFFGGRKICPNVELLPGVFVLAMIVYLVIISRLNLYDITDTAIDSLVETGDTGIVSFDQALRYVGSNGTAKAVFPQLKELTVDRPVDQNAFAAQTFLPWLRAFQQDPAQNSALYRQGDKTYLVQISDLFNGFRKRGYQFFIKDDTKNQQYIQLINTFNSQLQAEVAQKTAHIVEMHDNLIMSMATMVESRDNSTGGHIRRTSQGVKLLVDEMKKDPAMALTPAFRANIIKAAPMHDLGKIAVDDAILRKPGRFTPEEFEKMKVHAAEGARIVHEILKATDDLAFHLLAENVAHYHHERWDGSGYPDGLKGDEIPLEARIMAIADVYDALVSKRVYKDSMSFEQADAIITEGMGKHFDPQLAPYYAATRPRLEQYYAGLEEQGNDHRSV